MQISALEPLPGYHAWSYLPKWMQTDHQENPGIECGVGLGVSEAPSKRPCLLAIRLWTTGGGRACNCPVK